MEGRARGRGINRVKKEESSEGVGPVRQPFSQSVSYQQEYSQALEQTTSSYQRQQGEQKQGGDAPGQTASSYQRQQGEPKYIGDTLGQPGPSYQTQRGGPKHGGDAIGPAELGYQRKQVDPKRSPHGNVCGDVAKRARKPRRGAMTVIETEKVTRAKGFDKKGSIGQPVSVTTNLFRFEIGKMNSFQQYHVNFSPPVESIGFKRHLIKCVQDTLGIKGKNITDGMQLFVPFLIDESLLKNLEVTLPGKETYKIAMQHVGSIASTSPCILQMLNVLFKTVGLQGCGLSLIGDGYFKTQDTAKVSGTHLEVVPGYFSSILEYEGGVRLMLDVSHKVLSSYTVLDYANNIMEDKHLSQDAKLRKIKTFLIGRIVMTKYNNKTYRIDDIDMTKTPASKFSMKREESPVTFEAYYRQRYQINIRNLNQPLLLSKAKRRDIRAGAPEHIYLIPELCLITGISEDVRSNFQMMKSLAQVTKLAPDARARRLDSLVKQMMQNREVQEKFRGFNIEMHPNMVQLAGRKLPDIKPQTGKGRLSTWNEVTRGSLLIPVSLNKWTLVCPRIHESNTPNFLKLFLQVCQSMGVAIKEPSRICYDNDRDMPEIVKRCVGEDLVVVVLRTANNSSYSAVKRYLCQTTPILSQVLTGRIYLKMNFSIASKVALQVTCKLGGAGWTMDRISLDDTMIIGIDTYHDSEQRGKSVVGVVATLDRNCTKFFTTWGWQQRSQEIGTCLHQAISDCLKAFKKANKKDCKQVILFRDGVGDGQLAIVLDTEVQQIKNAFAEHGLGNMAFAMIVVKKRNNTRFFVKSGPHYTNPSPGLVVDTEATRPMWYDFFLVSQEVREGSVTPTHFNVIYDTTALSPDFMQNLAYKQCHGYFNWTGPIRVPSVCQYAHKVAFLIGQSLHTSPDDSLKSKLFYL